MIFCWANIAVAHPFFHFRPQALILVGNSSLLSFYPCSFGGVDSMDLGRTGLSDFSQPHIPQDFAGGFLISAGFEPGEAGSPPDPKIEDCTEKGKVARWIETEP